MYVPVYAMNYLERFHVYNYIYIYIYNYIYIQIYIERIFPAPSMPFPGIAETIQLFRCQYIYTGI